MPRCQQRNSSRRHRTSSPSLERFVPVLTQVSNAKNPDGAGTGYIEAWPSHVSRRFAQACIASKLRARQHALMRPLILNPLFASLTSLHGVGPKLEKLYAYLFDREAPRVVDLLFHLAAGGHRPAGTPKIA